MADENPPRSVPDAGKESPIEPSPLDGHDRMRRRRTANPSAAETS